MPVTNKMVFNFTVRFEYNGLLEARFACQQLLRRHGRKFVPNCMLPKKKVLIDIARAVDIKDVLFTFCSGSR